MNNNKRFAPCDFAAHYRSIRLDKESTYLLYWVSQYSARTPIMRDKDVRAALLRKIGQEMCGRVVPELGICRGRARIDVSVINGQLHGFEIKSESDTLERLPLQQLLFSRVFDFVTLVASANHISRVLAVLPTWWGVISAIERDGLVDLEAVRHSQRNPSVDPVSVAQLLWRDEALEVLQRRGLAHGLSSKPRVALWSVLARELTLEELSDTVRDRLKARPNWRPEAQRMSDDVMFQSVATL